MSDRLSINMSNEQLEDLSMFEDTDMQVDRNVYERMELSRALPCNVEEVASPSLLSPSPSPASSPSPALLTQQRPKKRSHHTYTKDEVSTVLRAYFIEGLTMVEAGAKVDMPGTTVSKLIRTYRPQMPPPPPRPRTRSPQTNIITSIDNDVLAAILRR